ncbi:hypothetical protein C0992_010986 [Termitomyces sp. T32_za158]|nr:hypothetical protein C0992_010986 [Termitomyces sp. T32_za158]
MSTPFLPIQQLVQSNIYSREEIQTTQQKAEDAINKLRHTGDSEVADVLLARCEELKKRSSKLLKEYPEETSTTQGEYVGEADVSA